MFLVFQCYEFKFCCWSNFECMIVGVELASCIDSSIGKGLMLFYNVYIDELGKNWQIVIIHTNT